MPAVQNSINMLGHAPGERLYCITSNKLASCDDCAIAQCGNKLRFGQAEQSTFRAICLRRYPLSNETSGLKK